MAPSRQTKTFHEAGYHCNLIDLPVSEATLAELRGYLQALSRDGGAPDPQRLRQITETASQGWVQVTVAGADIHLRCADQTAQEAPQDAIGAALDALEEGAEDAELSLDLDAAPSPARPVTHAQMMNTGHATAPDAPRPQNPSAKDEGALQADLAAARTAGATKNHQGG
ncbi:hypothetical protein ERN12_00565 [Rhodobacteraceae bacterium]|nr:hypothetical protein ERN12_00565 [Paracoccaceae bacterium]